MYCLFLFLKRNADSRVTMITGFKDHYEDFGLRMYVGETRVATTVDELSTDNCFLLELRWREMNKTL